MTLHFDKQRGISREKGGTVSMGRIRRRGEGVDQSQGNGGGHQTNASIVAQGRAAARRCRPDGSVSSSKFRHQVTADKQKLKASAAKVSAERVSR